VLQNAQNVTSPDIAQLVFDHINVWLFFLVFLVCAIVCVIVIWRNPKPFFTVQKLIVFECVLLSAGTLESTNIDTLGFFVFTFLLQYLFSTLFEPFCYTFPNKRRTCFTVNLFDSILTVCVRWIYIAMFLYWYELLLLFTAVL
jgi:hypothetical protein